MNRFRDDSDNNVDRALLGLEGAMNTKFLTASVAILWLGGCTPDDRNQSDAEDPYSAMAARVNAQCAPNESVVAPDRDADGFGDLWSDPKCVILPAPGFAELIGDCDDMDKNVNPRAVEDTTNWVDDNCNNLINEVGNPFCKPDGDDDNHAVSGSFQSTDGDCDDPGEAWPSEPFGDCDDKKSSINVDRAEQGGNKIDDNCNDVVDEASLVWFKDVDNDGYGDSKAALVAAIQPVGYVSSTIQADCNDADKQIYPGASEVCNGKDDDCDGAPDEGTGLTDWYPDADADTYGVSLGQIKGCAITPAGFSSVSTDCNDGDKTVSPAATEACNGKDDDCDTLIDESGSAATWYADVDKDSFGSPLAPTTACVQPAGTVGNASDCNDADAAQKPGAVELAGDSKDQNCDGSELCFADGDDDGVRPDLTSITTSTNISCLDNKEAVAGDPTGDCDDNNNQTRPGAVEVCDTKDNDCDTLVDEGIGTTWYADADKDAFGNPGAPTTACAQPAGTVADNKDCDDTDANRNPGKAEVCDAKDNNCNGLVDDGAVGTTTWYLDNDVDTYGQNTATSLACVRPSGYAAQGGDCNDNNKAVNPLATEVCNGIDDDCDAAVDESGGTSVWYRDADGDTYGTPFTYSLNCSAPAGFVGNASDCLDTNALVKPGVTELVGDNLDQNCDGTETCYVDADNDTYRLTSTTISVDTDCLDSQEAVATDPTGECADNDVNRNPGKAEVTNGVDDDCDGLTDENVAARTQTTWTWTLDSAASSASMSQFQVRNTTTGELMIPPLNSTSVSWVNGAKVLTVQLWTRPTDNVTMQCWLNNDTDWCASQYHNGHVVAATGPTYTYTVNRWTGDWSYLSNGQGGYNYGATVK